MSPYRGKVFLYSYDPYEYGIRTVVVVLFIGCVCGFLFTEQYETNPQYAHQPSLYPSPVQAMICVTKEDLICT